MIDRAFNRRNPSVVFSLVTGNSYFTYKTSHCELSFEKNECIITTGSSKTIHKILKEDEYNAMTNWEPDQFLPRQRLHYERNSPTLVDIPINSTEGSKIKDYFYLTIPQIQSNVPMNQLVKIQRIFYPNQAEIFDQNLKRAREIHADNYLFQNNINYKKMLWHGTNNTDPSHIVRNGWLLAYTNCIGVYFSCDAAQAMKHAYQDKNTGNKKMILAQVIVGLPLHCLENANIAGVPEGYNSIMSYIKGAWYTIIYDNQFAFPSYLVEWN